MPFNTSQLINLLRAEAPDVDAFQACLTKATTLNFTQLDETENKQLHQMLGLGVQTCLPAAALFFAVLFSKVAQNTASDIPGQLLIATLKKLHALGDENLLICLVNAINLIEALPSTLDLELPGLPQLKVSNPQVQRLKLNLLELTKTMRVNEAQVQHAIHFDRQHTNWTLGFSRFLTQTRFDWKADEAALLTLLPNDEGLFTALGFLHGLHHTVKQTIEPEKLENHRTYYSIEKKPAHPTVTLNVDITTRALKKNLPHPVPFMLITDEKTITISEHLVIAVFLNPKLTHQHLFTLANALRRYDIKLVEYTFNQRLLNAAPKAPIVTDERKPQVLTDHLGWDPNQTYRVKISKHGVIANLDNLMTQLIQRDSYEQGHAITTLFVLLTLPQIKLNRGLVSGCIKAIKNSMYNNITIITHTINYLLNNPSLNAPDAVELKREAFDQIIVMLRSSIESDTQHNNRKFSIIKAICNLLLTLKNDEVALFRIVELINAQKKAVKAQSLFNNIIKHPALTNEQRDELDARTNDRRQREEEDPTLVMWPEPITHALLQKPSVRTLQAAIYRELGHVIDDTAPAFEFDEAFPHLPKNEISEFQYDQLPLAVLIDETLQKGMILQAKNILSLPLSLLVFRNREFKPTHHELCRHDRSNGTRLNIVIFTLLGHADLVFKLPASDSHCLDSYVDTVIRLMINTKLLPSSHNFQMIALKSAFKSSFQSEKNTIIALLELAEIPYAITPDDNLNINLRDLEARLFTTLKKYLTLPAVRLALYQKDILDENCLMKSMLSEKNRSPDELRGTPVTEATLSTLSSRLATPNTCDFRSAILFMALSGEAIDSPRLNKIIYQHLLRKALTEHEKNIFIDALKLLDRETLTELKENITAWFMSHPERRKIAEQLIQNDSSETNPLLLTLMMEPHEYGAKKTTHYKALTSTLNKHEKTKEDQAEQELRVMQSTVNLEEEAPLNDIKTRSRAFITAAFNGEITWSEAAPFLPLPGQAHLPLEQFSLAGISPEELWEPLLKQNKMTYQFLLFLLRHEETRWLVKDEHRSESVLPRYLVAFTLLGKNQAIFNLKADETRHLMSYEAALIKHAIESRVLSESTPFRSKKKYAYNLQNPITLDAAIKTNFITSDTFNHVSHESVIELYMDYIRKNTTLAMALRQNQLLNHPSLLMPKPQYSSIAYYDLMEKLNDMGKCLKGYGATEATLQQCHTTIFAEGLTFLEIRIQCLVLYIAFSSETASIKDQIHSWLISPKPEIRHMVYNNAKQAVEKLGPAHIKHLKSQINAYCAEQKADPQVGEEIRVALSTDVNERSPFLLLLKIGQTSGELQLSGNYLRKLTLFYQGKAINEKDMVKYNLAPKPGAQ